MPLARPSVEEAQPVPVHAGVAAPGDRDRLPSRVYPAGGRDLGLCAWHGGPEPHPRDLAAARIGQQGVIGARPQVRRGDRDDAVAGGHVLRRHGVGEAPAGRHDRQLRAGRSAVVADGQRVADRDAARSGGDERRRRDGCHAEGRDDRPVVGRPRPNRDRDAGAAGLPHHPARDRAAGRVQHPVDAVEHLGGAALGAARRPREAGHGQRIGVHLAEAVVEPRLGERPADGPAHRVADVRPVQRDAVRPVQIRGRVEVAGQEDGNARRGDRGQGVQSCGRTQESRTDRSRRSTWPRPAPSRTRYGP